MDLLGVRFNEIPPVTRGWAVAVLLVSALRHFDIVSEVTLLYNYKFVVEGQYWRLVTSFVDLGPITLNSVLHSIFFIRHSASLESQYYERKPFDYLWTWFIACSLILFGVTVTEFTPALDRYLILSLLYVLTRKSHGGQIVLFGVIPLPAPYATWAIWALNIIPDDSNRDYVKNAVHQLLPIAVGHIIFYMDDVYPKINNGVQPLSPPWKWLLVREEDETNLVPDPEPADGVEEEL